MLNRWTWCEVILCPTIVVKVVIQSISDVSYILLTSVRLHDVRKSRFVVLVQLKLDF